MYKSARERNKRRDAQLGMPHTSALQKLRKMLLFKFLKELGYDKCFKCSESITKIDELSIEHIKPWENVSVELYWDLNNIAFSHVRCNKPYVLRSKFTEELKEITPEGKSWCYKCKDFLNVEMFHKSARQWNGLQQFCKQH